MVLIPYYGSKMKISSLLRSGNNELKFGPNVKYFNVLRLYVGFLSTAEKDRDVVVKSLMKTKAACFKLLLREYVVLFNAQFCFQQNC